MGNILRHILAQLQVEVKGVKELFGAVKALNKVKPAAEDASEGLKQVLGNAKNLAEFLNGGGGLLASIAKVRRVMNLGAFSAALGIGTLTAFLNRNLDSIDKIDKAAKKLGMTVESVQILDMFAQQSGVSMEQVEASTSQMTRNLENFVKLGKGEAADALRRLGFSRRQVAQWKSVDEAMFAIGGALGEVTNTIERNSLAQKTLGESGVKLMGGFAGGAKEVEKQRQSLKKLAVVYNKDTVAAVAEVNDRLAEAGAAWRKITRFFLEIALPVVRAMAVGLTAIGEGFHRVTKRLRPFRVAMIGATAALTLFLGRVAILKGMGVGAVFSTAWAAVSKFALMLRGLGGIAARFAVAFGPVIIAVTGLYIILEDLFAFLSGDESVIGMLVDDLFGVGTAAKVSKGFLSALSKTIDYLKSRAKVFLAFLTGGISQDTFFSVIYNDAYRLIEAVKKLYNILRGNRTIEFPSIREQLERQGVDLNSAQGRALLLKSGGSAEGLPPLVPGLASTSTSNENSVKTLNDNRSFEFNMMSSENMGPELVNIMREVTDPRADLAAVK